MSNAVRRRILDACLGLALVTGACKTEEPSVVPDTTGSAPTKTPPPVELAHVDHPSQVLPGDTSLLVTVRSIARAAEVFERERLKGEFRLQYEAISTAMRANLGHDMLDPAAWRDAGLDPEGPLGLSFSGPATNRFVVFGTVGDRAKLIAFARQVASNGRMELREEVYGTSTVLRAGGPDAVAVVIRDSLVALVIEARASENYDMAQIIATMDPNVSLAAQKGFRKATGGLHDADLTLFFDVGRVVEQENAEAESRTTGPESNWAQEELERAQKAGESPERLVQLEQQAAEIEQMQARWRRQAAAERALSSLIVSGVEGLGATVTVKRSGPVLDGRLVAGPDAFLRRLVDNREGSPVLVDAMNGSPIWCASGGIDGEAALEVAFGMAEVEGDGKAALLAEAKTELGLDLEADVKEAGIREAGFCAVLDGKFDPSAEDPSKQFGMGAYVQVSGDAKAKYLLAKVASARGSLASRMKKRGAGYSLAMPDWRTLYLDAVGDRVVISTDPDLAGRIAKGDPGSMPSKIQPTAARGAMALPGTAATQSLDLSMMTMTFAVGRMSFGEPVVTVGDMSPEEAKKVPESSRTKKARKALDKANRELEAMERERSAAEVETVMKATDALGILVTAAVEDERGFTLTGGEFIRAPSMGSILEGFLRLATERGPQFRAEDNAAFEKAWEVRNAAESEYMNARQEDLQRAVDKKNKKAPLKGATPAEKPAKPSKGSE